jgi:hypothetical protein
MTVSAKQIPALAGSARLVKATGRAWQVEPELKAMSELCHSAAASGQPGPAAGAAVRLVMRQESSVWRSSRVNRLMKLQRGLDDLGPPAVADGNWSGYAATRASRSVSSRISTAIFVRADAYCWL